jgi:hypothetical protein
MTTVIRRMECRKCGNISESYARPGRCVDDRCNGEMVEVEYVPAEQLRGAVETLREIAEAAEAQVEKLDPAINSAWVAGKARDAIKRSEKNRSDAPG